MTPVLWLSALGQVPALAKDCFGEIMQAVNALFNQVAQASIPLTNPTLAELEKAAQELLKQEWQKSKDEAATGRERRMTRSNSSANHV